MGKQVISPVSSAGTSLETRALGFKLFIKQLKLLKHLKSSKIYFNRLGRLITYILNISFRFVPNENSNSSFSEDFNLHVIMRQVLGRGGVLDRRGGKNWILAKLLQNFRLISTLIFSVINFKLA